LQLVLLSTTKKGQSATLQGKTRLRLNTASQHHGYCFTQGHSVVSAMLKAIKLHTNSVRCKLYTSGFIRTRIQQQAEEEHAFEGVILLFNGIIIGHARILRGLTACMSPPALLW
jgi:hypothetical protein